MAIFASRLGWGLLPSSRTGVLRSSNVKQAAYGDLPSRPVPSRTQHHRYSRELDGYPPLTIAKLTVPARNQIDSLGHTPAASACRRLPPPPPSQPYPNPSISRRTWWRFLAESKGDGPYRNGQPSEQPAEEWPRNQTRPDNSLGLWQCFFYLIGVVCYALPYCRVPGNRSNSKPKPSAESWEELGVLDSATVVKYAMRKLVWVKEIDFEPWQLEPQPFLKDEQADKQREEEESVAQ